jgi:uncharacterized protein (TIGR01777 family)
MQVLISGGTGSIGRALTKSLVAEGHTVTILSRKPGNTSQTDPNVRVLHWDGKSSAAWEQVMENVDAVVNLAGENLSAGLWTKKRKQSIVESRKNAGLALTRAIQHSKRKPAVFLQVSGVGCYGVSETQTFTEEAEYGSDYLAGVCRVWESSTQTVEELGLRRTVARLGVVLNKTDGALPRMALPFHLFAGGALGHGRQWLSWVHMQDAVRAIRFLIENPEAQGIYNISATPVTNRQFAKTLGKVLHRPALLQLPSFVLRTLLGEMSTIVLDGQRVSAKRLQDLGFKFSYPELEAALKAIYQ